MTHISPTAASGYRVKRGNLHCPDGGMGNASLPLILQKAWEWFFSQALFLTRCRVPFMLLIDACYSLELYFHLGNL